MTSEVEAAANEPQIASAIPLSLFAFSIFYGGMLCIAGVLGAKQVALGPLAVRPSYFPRALPWLMQWVKAGKPERVLQISDAIRGEMAELKKEFSKSMEAYFDFCREEGEEPDEPFSGKFVLRVDPSVHRAITRAAEREGISINKWAEHQLEIAAGGSA